MPAYVVLTNRDIDTLVRDRPDSLAALGRVRGIGKAKLSRYGNALLALLRGDSPDDADQAVATDATPPAPRSSPEDVESPASSAASLLATTPAPATMTHEASTS